MNEKCKHETTSILGYHSNVSLEVCDWGCGAVLVSVTDDNGISHVFTPDELLALREQLANNHTAVSVYQRDIAALRERVAALETVLKTIAHQFKTSEEIINTPFDEIGLEPAEHLEMAYDNMQAVAAVALAEGSQFTKAANNLLETKADLWQKMADEGGE